MGVIPITLFANHDHRHVRPSGWPLRRNSVHHRKTFCQSRSAGLLLVYAFKADPNRKTTSRAATSQRGSAFDKWPTSRGLRISLHKGFSRYCISEQKDVIQNELNHVSSNLKDGLLLLLSPQCDAMLSRNRNPPRPGYQVLFPRGHYHQRRRFPLQLWSLLHLPLPKYLRIRSWIPNKPPNPRDGGRRSNLHRWYWMRT